MHRVSLQEKELSCPVCIDIFDEPKALPQCAHNVCHKCLDVIATRNRWKFVTCPVCRVQSYLPPGGVSSLPTNHFMKTVINGLPGRKEVQSMKKAMEQCEEDLRSSKSHVDDCDRFIASLKTAQENAQQVKKEIADHSDYLIDLIQKERASLTNQVDQRIETIGSLLSSLRKERKKTLHTVKESEKIVCEAKGLIERGNIQEIIDKKVESVSKLEASTAILAISRIFIFPDLPESIHFTKPTEFRTGGEILGCLRRYSAMDDDCALEAEFEECTFQRRGSPIQPYRFPRPYSLEMQEAMRPPGFRRVSSPRSQRSLPPLPVATRLHDMPQFKPIGAKHIHRTLPQPPLSLPPGRSRLSTNPEVPFHRPIQE